MMIPFILFALLPIISILVLLLALRWPADKAMSSTLLLTAVIALSQWQLQITQIVIAVAKGFLISLNVLYVIFAAVLLLRLLELGGAVARIDKVLGSVSKDRRIQAILIAWLFGAFIEGAAGFGTPQALSVPLLISLGFPALAAVMLSVMSNSSPVSFGAAGVPITIGIGSFAPEYVHAVTRHTALIHGLIGSIFPIILVCALTRYYGKQQSWKEGLEVLPFALFAGAAFTIPMMISAFLFGPELASIIGGIAGLCIVVPAASRGFLVPKKIWDFPPRSQWPATWSGTHQPHMHKGIATTMTAFLPYIIVAILLIITRLDALPVKQWLQSLTLTVPLGMDSYTFQLAYSAGTIFLIGTLISVALYRLTLRNAIDDVKDALHRLYHPLIALTGAVGTVQVILATSNNPLGLPGMPETLASVASGLGSSFTYAAPFIGILGAFLAGSNTIANLLFGPLQLKTALMVGLAPAIILSLQTVGGAAGNMIAVHNIVAASAAGGLHHREAEVIRATILPCLLYGALAVAIGLLLIAMA